MKTTAIARIRQIRQSLFARFTGVQTSVDHASDRERKSAAVRQLYRILNNDSTVWVPTQVVADRSSGVFARLRRGAYQRVAALTIRNPFSEESLERTKRAFAFSFIETSLEKRQLLATTSLSSGLLTINLDAVGEILTLTSNGSTLSLSSSSAITGAGSSFASSSVTRLAVSDSGLLAGQSFNFGTGAAFSFSSGVAVSNIESVMVNGDVSVSGSASFSVTASQSIQTAASLTTGGGPLDLVAKSDIVITQPILTNGGVQTLTADSDTDGSGNLSLNFSITQVTDPNPNTGNQFGSTVLVLSSGNVVVTSPYDDAGGTDAGAVYLFNGFTGQLISTLIGSSAYDSRP